MSEAKTIAIAHHAGGVGKTTTTLNLGFELALAGKRVLLVDLDPQADLSDRLLLKDNDTLSKALLYNDDLGPKVVSWLKSELWVVSSSLNMAATEVMLIAEDSRERRLRWALNNIKNSFDYILIDCPPSLSVLTTNAFYAADAVIVTVQAQNKAYNAVDLSMTTIKSVSQARRRDNPEDGLQLFGLLITMVDNTKMARDITGALRQEFGSLVFETTIPTRARAREDSEYHGPLAYYAANDDATRAYHALAQEVISRAETPALSR